MLGHMMIHNIRLRHAVMKTNVAEWKHYFNGPPTSHLHHHGFCFRRWKPFHFGRFSTFVCEGSGANLDGRIYLRGGRGAAAGSQ